MRIKFEIEATVNASADTLAAVSWDDVGAALVAAFNVQCLLHHVKVSQRHLSIKQEDK